MYFFHKILSQFLGFDDFFRAFQKIFPSEMPHCTCFICPIYKIRIGVSSVIPSSSIHIYYRSISGSYQSVCFSPRRNTSRKMARVSDPQYSSCQHRAMGILQPQVCTQVPKPGSSPNGTIVRTHRAESGILHVPSSIFQELHNFMFLSLCTLRIDKLLTFGYNKARNQRSTAEAQERANPADLKQKGAKTDG